MDKNITFSKIVTTPTLNSWSQAYNAGKLFAVLSLERTSGVNQDLESLNLLGRDLLDKLEQEFFTIDNKELDSIKTAVANTFQNNPDTINISFAACAFVNNILYLFALGKGKVFIKRDGKFGLLLDSTADPQNISLSSGFVKDNDLIVLATNAFSETITNDDLDLNLTSVPPSEIAESFAPRIHKAENGKISAIIIKYLDSQIPPETIAIDDPQPNIDEAKADVASLSPFSKYLTLLKSIIKKPNILFNPRKKLFLALAIAIAGILIFSVFSTIQKQNDAKIAALFETIYPEAQKKYDEGQSLLDLNKNLAEGSFLASQKILNENKDKFPAKSKESLQIQDLLQKVDQGLKDASPVDKSGLDRSKLSITVVNGSGIEGYAARGATILKKIGYSVSSTGNADNYNYQGVTIKVKKEKSNFLDLLKKDLAKDYTVSSTSSDLPDNSTTDALIIIGK